MNGENEMKTVCCGHKFHFLINSPIRQRGEWSYQCTNCEHIFSEDEIKIVSCANIEDIELKTEKV